MKLTTRGRYAVTAMLDLAIHGDEPLPLAAIAQRNSISVAYLERLFASLRQAGLVRGTRGPGGGYCLARAAEAISVANVIEAVDEGLDATRCGGLRNCQGDGPCLTHDLWADLTRHIESFLDAVTLAQLCERAGQRVAADSGDSLRRIDVSRIAGALR